MVGKGKFLYLPLLLMGFVRLGAKQNEPVAAKGILVDSPVLEDQSNSLLFPLITSSDKQAIQRHLLMAPSTGWYVYFELASMRRRRLLTIDAVVR